MTTLHTISYPLAFNYVQGTKRIPIDLPPKATFQGFNLEATHLHHVNLHCETSTGVGSVEKHTDRHNSSQAGAQLTLEANTGLTPFGGTAKVDGNQSRDTQNNSSIVADHSVVELVIEAFQPPLSPPTQTSYFTRSNKKPRTTSDMPFATGTLKILFAYPEEEPSCPLPVPPSPQPPISTADSSVIATRISISEKERQITERIHSLGPDPRANATDTYVQLVRILLSQLSHSDDSNERGLIRSKILLITKYPEVLAEHNKTQDQLRSPNRHLSLPQLNELIIGLKQTGHTEESEELSSILEIMKGVSKQNSLDHLYQWKRDNTPNSTPPSPSMEIPFSNMTQDQRKQIIIEGFYLICKTAIISSREQEALALIHSNSAPTDSTAPQNTLLDLFFSF